MSRARAGITGGVCSACLPLFPEAFARARRHADEQQRQRQEAAIRRRAATDARRAPAAPGDELAARRARRAGRS